MQMQVYGIDKALKKFRDLENSMGGDGSELKRVLDRGAKLIRARVRDEAPLGPTGNLRKMIGASLKLRYSPGKPEAQVHAFAPHAWLVEYGHIKQNGEHHPGNSFFRRGVERSEGIVMHMIGREMERLVKRAAGNGTA